jgi:cytochrome c553
MMRITPVGMLLIAVMCGSSANAADVAAGKEKAELCICCHGEGGISQMENIPSLAGQPDQFIQWQLVFFRAGTRKNEQMQPIVEQINNDDIRNLGAYFASLTPPKATKPDDNPRFIHEGRTGCRGTALRFVPRRQLRRNESGRPHRWPTRGIPAQGAARLQVRRAIRRRHGSDG